jgi:hypothetical protein
MGTLSTETKHLDVIVFQAVPEVIGHIRHIAEEMKAMNPGNYINEVSYTSDPKYVLEKVASDLNDKMGSVVVSSQQMFFGKGLFEYTKHLLAIGNRVEDVSEHLDEFKNTGTCNYLAALIKRINPTSWVFRYSTNPSKCNDALTGDIPKKNLFEIVEFINSPLLPVFYANKDIISLKERFPQIIIYEKPKDKLPIRFIHAS